MDIEGGLFFLVLGLVLASSPGNSGAALVHQDTKIANITRQNNGDAFNAEGNECTLDTCVGLSSGTAGPPRDGSQVSSCGCQCHLHLPAFREDLQICVDDIHECVLSPFVSGSMSQRIPFVFLPLKGQIIHPSKEISFAGIQTPVCAVSGAKFLTDAGWIDLRNPVDTDVPFRLYRDEGRTFLQWVGEPELRTRMSGRLVLVHLMCREIANSEKITSEIPTVFTPCVAFRVVGTPTKYLSNVSEVVFIPDNANSESLSSGGLSISEYVAIGICSVLLGLIYVASVFLYLHLRKRRKESDKNVVGRENQALSSVEEGIIKNNPLLGLGRHFAGVDTGYSDSGSSDTDAAPDIIQHHDDRKKNITVTSVMVHPQHKFNSMFNQQLMHQDSIEKLPEENVSIIETLEGREDRNEMVKVIGSTRRKLYFNPAYFDPQLLIAPPPAAVEFLTKIREVISLAKQKMASNRFTPSLNEIPEEDPNYLVELSRPIGSRRGSAISLKRENSRRKTCSGCPGCEPQDFKALSGKLPEFPSLAACHNCASNNSDSKQISIRKWLEDVPIIKTSSGERGERTTKSLQLSPKRIRSPTRSLSPDHITPIIRKGLERCGSPTSEALYDNKTASIKSASSSKRSSSTVKTAITSRKSLGKPKAPQPPVSKCKSNIYDVIPERSFSSMVHPPSHLSPGSNLPGYVPSGNLPSNCLSSSSLPPVHVPPNRLCPNNLPPSHVPSNNLPPSCLPQSNLPSRRLPPSNLPSSRPLASNFLPNNVPSSNLPSNVNGRPPGRLPLSNLPASRPSNGLPPPDMIQEAMVVENKLEAPQVPTITKKMNAVINELSTLDHIKANPDLQNGAIDYDSDSLERSRMNGYNTPTDYAEISSSQPSPSLSAALPMDEEMTMQNAIINTKTGNMTISKLNMKEVLQPDDHDYEVIVLKKTDNPIRLPEILQRGSCYSLVSEVYVNNGYNYGSAPSTPSDSNCSTLERPPKIIYEPNNPGHLLIEVKDCPDNYIKAEDSDSYEPDTLDRKPNKLKIVKDVLQENEYIDSLERPNHILLRTTGSFKKDDDSTEPTNEPASFNRNFGSLREIYEAKTKRQCDDSTWKIEETDYEGRLLTLEERHCRRQRKSANIPPDVIPPNPTLEPPIYERPKPPRKVVPKDDDKPPLPPKNGSVRGTGNSKHFGEISKIFDTSENSNVFGNQENTKVFSDASNSNVFCQPDNSCNPEKPKVFSNPGHSNVFCNRENSCNPENSNSVSDPENFNLFCNSENLRASKNFKTPASISSTTAENPKIFKTPGRIFRSSKMYNPETATGLNSSETSKTFKVSENFDNDKNSNNFRISKETIGSPDTGFDNYENSKMFDTPENVFRTSQIFGKSQNFEKTKSFDSKTPNARSLDTYENSKIFGNNHSPDTSKNNGSFSTSENQRMNENSGNFGGSKNLKTFGTLENFSAEENHNSFGTSENPIDNSENYGINKTSSGHENYKSFGTNNSRILEISETFGSTNPLKNFRSTSEHAKISKGTPEDFQRKDKLSTKDNGTLKFSEKPKFSGSKGKNHEKPKRSDVSILKNFIHTDDILFKNGVNNQIILQASTITTNQVDVTKKSWGKIVKPEDSGYLSTDSSDSRKKKCKDCDRTSAGSETDESLGDGHSESGGESVETHSVFFGSFRKSSCVAGSVDSGVGSELKNREGIVGISEVSSDSETYTIAPLKLTVGSTPQTV